MKSVENESFFLLFGRFSFSGLVSAAVVVIDVIDGVLGINEVIVGGIGRILGGILGELGNML